MLLFLEELHPADAMQKSDDDVAPGKDGLNTKKVCNSSSFQQLVPRGATKKATRMGS
jgi:hypothetical protein